MTATKSELTIDQLAQRTGMSARNIRAHQSRGLLAPPELHGRTGYYGPDHLARIELIQTLQRDGFSLELIQRLLRSAGGSTEDARRFAEAMHAPWGDEQPQTVELSEVQRRFRSESRKVLARVEELGLLRIVDHDRVEFATPEAWRAAGVFADLGTPVERLLDVAGEVREHIDAIAASFVRLYVDQVWRPFDEGGKSDESLDDVLATTERLRPLAVATVASLFQLAMRDAAERRLGPEIERLDRS